MTLLSCGAAQPDPTWNEASEGQSQSLSESLSLHNPQSQLRLYRVVFSIHSLHLHHQQFPTGPSPRHEVGIESADSQSAQ